MKRQLGHLLVVDDNEMNREMLSRRLSKRGHTVAVAEDGQRALEMIKGEEFDLVLLDVMMPRISGLEVLKRLRQAYSVLELPIIMVTAKGQSEDVVEAFELGANDYVTKPLDFSIVQARVQTQLALRHLAQFKDEFLRIASHDLKNTLTAIIGGIQVVQEMMPPGATVTERIHELLSKLYDSAENMYKIIIDFLDFQATEDGHLKLEKSPKDLNAIARQAVHGNSDYAVSKETSLVLEPEAGLVHVNADGERLEQVIQNLVNNAIKFCPRGSQVTVRTRSEDGWVRLEVCDNGPGLTDDDLQRAFTKYCRLSNLPTGGERSFGLGLAICRQIVELHCGRIGVHNNPTRGATFWFRLPVG